MKKSLCSLVSGVICVIAAACANISYEGVSREALPGAEEVTVYFSAKDIENAVYETLGEAVAASDNNSYTAAELEAKLRRLAAEKGANAILITAVERVPVGRARPDQIKNQRAMSWTVDDDSYSSFQYFREDMLNYSNTEGGRQNVYNVTIRAKFLYMTVKPAPAKTQAAPVAAPAPVSAPAL